MPIATCKWITRKMLRSNPSTFFVFGDNEIRQGMGGQAKEMRGEPNAIGIRTKKLPSNEPNAFWTDRDMVRCCGLVEDDITSIEKILSAGATVVFPEDGVGTGYSNLQEHAPAVLSYINIRMARLKTKYGQAEWK